MLILKKLDTSSVNKTIQSGNTEEFFNLSLEDYDAFDWLIKISNGVEKGSFRINSLYDNSDIDSIEYAYLGYKFNIEISIYVFSGDRCKLEVTNNETSSVDCFIRLNTY